MRVIVTGASGFIGKRFVEYNKLKFEIIPISIKDKIISDLNLQNADVIVHLAGKAHEMSPIDDNIYFQVNYELTKQLAERAIQEKVPHFIYFSSTKIYGDELNTVLNEYSSPNPNDAYGKSKLQAEFFLKTVNSENFKVAIIRPPLVYGPEVKGNMIKLLELANKKIPLPFGNINNKRSIVFIDNLIELINKIINKKASGIFIAGDQEAISTTTLLSLIRKHLNNQNKLISIPFFIRQIIKRIKPGLYIRLFDSFIIDNSETNNKLNFMPPYTTDYGINCMTQWFKQVNKEQ